LILFDVATLYLTCDLYVNPVTSQFSWVSITLDVQYYLHLRNNSRRAFWLVKLRI